MLLDLNHKESVPLIHQIKDSTRKPTDNQKNTIPAFDLYSKVIDDSNGNERVTTFVCEIRISPNNTKLLKNLLCNFLNEGDSNLRFVPYGIQSLSKQGTMKNIIFQHNMFLQNTTIVPIININENDKEYVKKLFESSLYFSGFEATRKLFEGMYY